MPSAWPDAIEALDCRPVRTGYFRHDWGSDLRLPATFTVLPFGSHRLGVVDPASQLRNPKFLILLCANWDEWRRRIFNSTSRSLVGYSVTQRHACDTTNSDDRLSDSSIFLFATLIASYPYPISPFSAQYNLSHSLWISLYRCPSHASRVQDTGDRQDVRHLRAAGTAFTSEKYVFFSHHYTRSNCVRAFSFFSASFFLITMQVFQ